MPRIARMLCVNLMPLPLKDKVKKKVYERLKKADEFGSILEQQTVN